MRWELRIEELFRSKPASELKKFLPQKHQLQVESNSGFQSLIMIQSRLWPVLSCMAMNCRITSVTNQPRERRQLIANTSGRFQTPKLREKAAENHCPSIFTPRFKSFHENPVTSKNIPKHLKQSPRFYTFNQSTLQSPWKQAGHQKESSIPIINFQGPC